jgi:hypothetical protein
MRQASNCAIQTRRTQLVAFGLVLVRRLHKHEGATAEAADAIRASGTSQSPDPHAAAARVGWSDRRLWGSLDVEDVVQRAFVDGQFEVEGHAE